MSAHTVDHEAGVTCLPTVELDKLRAASAKMRELSVEVRAKYEQASRQYAADTTDDYEEGRADAYGHVVATLDGLSIHLNQVCQWKADDDGNWHTACRQLHILIEGGPRDNSMQFCCYCGGTLNEATR